MFKRIMPFAAAAVLLSSCGTTPKEAASFNDKLMLEQKNVVMKYDALLETYDTYVPAKMDDALLEFQSQVESAIYQVKNIDPVSGGSALHETMLNYLETYHTVAVDDAVELVRLYKVPENEFTSEMRSQWDLKYKDVDSRLKSADAALKARQEEFAKNFGLRIQ